jgi:hypothetical protein
MTRARDVADNQENLGGGVPPFVAGKNKIINGDFSVWQRGTTFTSPGAGSYTADRFREEHDGTTSAVTVTRQTFAPGTAPVAGYEGAYFLRDTLTTVGNGTYLQVAQFVEDVRTFAGQTVTLSFWAKADSARTSIVFLAQQFGTGGSSTVYSSTPSITYSTSWQRFSYTFDLPSIAGKTIGTGSSLAIGIRSTATTGSVLDIWGVQLEAGNVATPFTTATGTIQGELAACQRYYQIITAGVVTATNSTTRVAFSAEFPPMRTTTPTFSLTSNLVITDLFTANFTQSAPEITVNINNGNNGATLSFNNFSGLTAYRGYQLQGNQFILASAEL